MTPPNVTRTLLLATSCALALSLAKAQGRPVFEFERPPSSNVIDPGFLAEHESEQADRDDRLDIRRDIAWQMSVKGAWNYELEGVGAARTGMGGDRSTDSLIIATLELEEGERPLTLSIINAGGAELGHVAFSQTGTPRNDAAFYSLGANYLTPEGREPRSIAGSSYLANHDGFVRFDRRNDGLVIHFTIDAVLCANIEEPPYISQPPCVGQNFIRSYPSARATVTGCLAETNQFVAGACDLPFQVDSVTPTNRRENVNHHDPGITVTFSEPADTGSLNDSFALFTRAPDGAPLTVEGDWQRGSGPSTYRFTPEDGSDLRSGVIMEARVESGLEGVRSRDGEKWLDEDKVWHFSTLLDLADEENPHSFDIELETFQVVRDAPLTRGKPTLSRVYLDWELHDDVAEAWQPESYPVRFELSPEHPRMIGQFHVAPRHKNVARIHRDEVFNDNNRRLAHHTVNFFGWEPDGRGAAPMRLELSHHDPFPGPSAQNERTWLGETDIWQHDPAPHGLVYSIALVGSWADGIPETVFSRITSGLNKMSRMVPQFFPYREAQVRPAGFNIVEGRPGGPHELGVSGLAFGHRTVEVEATEPTLVQQAMQNDAVVAFLGWDAIPEDQRGSPPAGTVEEHIADHNTQLNQLLLQAIQDARLATWMTPNDTYIVFVPPDFMDAAGIAYGGSARSSGNALNGIVSVPGMRVLLVVATDEAWLDTDTMTQALLHELGHEHGLRHNPGNAGPNLPPGARYLWDFGIEAWRMDPSGLAGANKSSTEGNAEHADVMASMMWPWAMPTDEMSVTASEYRALMTSIVMGTDATEFDFGSLAPRFPYFVAAAKTATVMSDALPSPLDYLVVSGMVAPHERRAEIHDFHLVTAPPANDPDGSLRAQLRADDGSLIGETAFAPLEPRHLVARPGHSPEPEHGLSLSLPESHFLVTLPADLRTASVVIMDGDDELARHDAPPARPEFLESPQVLLESEEELLIGWRMAEADSSTFSVAYSPTGHAPWHRLYTRFSTNAVVIPSALLAPGHRPTLKVTAQDGIRFSRRELRLDAPEASGPEIIALPSAAAFAEGEPLTLAFATDIPTGALQAGIRIIDANGDPLETDLYYRRASGLASLLAPVALEPQEGLELEVDANLTDIHNRPVGAGLRIPLP